jgi:hypothetical protein
MIVVIVMLQVQEYAWKRLGPGDEGAERLRVCYSLMDWTENV